jgi:multiple sugar transport system permease protein
MKWKRKRQLAALASHAVLTLFSLLILLPLLWVVRTSLAPEVVAYEIPPRLVFRPTLTNYQELFAVNEFARFYRNSLVVAVGSTILAIPIAALGGYAFARYRTGGRPLQFTVLGTQMLPGIVLILPLFVVYKALGLTNSLSGLVLAYLSFNLPFLVWILMGFYEGIPRELEEAALIDGATPVQAFARVIFPTSAPGVMATAVLSFILCWNEFLFALILTGAESSTVPVALAALQTQRGVLIGKLSSGVILGILPVLLLAPFIQRYLVRGLTFGAIK